MSRHGFVYLLGNRAMPHLYKIGRTEGSPTFRAQQLSSGSGVPRAFDVICYFESDDCARDEKFLHHFLDDFRVNMNREFFRFVPVHMQWVYGLFRWHPYQLAFADGESWLYVNPGNPEVNPWESGRDEPRMTEYAPDTDADAPVASHLRLVGR